MVRHVHSGWVVALIAGGITWAIATFFIGVSGASRELTEGFGSLFAAAVLLSVGIWMHGKSQAGEWQRYINETLRIVLTLVPVNRARSPIARCAASATLNLHVATHSQKLLAPTVAGGCIGSP